MVFSIITGVILTVVGLMLFFFYGWTYALGLPLIMARRATFRVIFLYVAVPCGRMFLTARQRDACDQFWVDLKERISQSWIYTKETWIGAPWWRRVVLALTTGCTMGGIAVVCIIFPSLRAVLLGETMRQKVIPYLMNRAALSKIEESLPVVLRKVPAPVRAFTARQYRRLWLATAVSTGWIRRAKYTERTIRRKKISTK